MKGVTILRFYYIHETGYYMKEVAILGVAILGIAILKRLLYERGLPQYLVNFPGGLLSNIVTYF